MNTHRDRLRLALLAVSGALALVARPTSAAPLWANALTGLVEGQVCSAAGGVPTNLTIGSWLESTMNPPSLEDVSFFTTPPVSPNVGILIGSSDSMANLPPNGPASLSQPLSSEHWSMPYFPIGGGANPWSPTALPTGCVILYTTGMNSWYPFTGDNGFCVGRNIPSGQQIFNIYTAPSPVVNGTPDRIVGCGLDSVTASDPNLMTHPAFKAVMARTYQPPCGNAANQSLVGQPYAGDPSVGGPDYNKQPACPFFNTTTGILDPNQQTSGTQGYDPDYYQPLTTVNGVLQIVTTLSNGHPNFFPSQLVFHDTQRGIQNQAEGLANLAGYPISAGPSSYTNIWGDGWDFTHIYPAPEFTGSTTAGKNVYATGITDFCNNFPGATFTQGGQTWAQICTQCLQQRGWWYDGTLLTDVISYQMPSYTSFWVNFVPQLWYTGNYLAFFPPKFMLVRKAVKDLAGESSNVRLGVFQYNPNYPYPTESSGATGNQNATLVVQAFNPPCSAPDNTPFNNYIGPLVSALNNMTWGGPSPTSMALLNVAQYFASPSLPWFSGNPVPNSSLTSWLDSSMVSSANDASYPVCYSCQSNNVVYIADSPPDGNEGTTPPLPTGTLTAAQLTQALYAGSSSTGIASLAPPVCPNCAAFPAQLQQAPDENNSDWTFLNNSIKVAFYFANMDLRNNSDVTLDCNSMGGQQTMRTWTIGVGASFTPNLTPLLQNIAAAGAPASSKISGYMDTSSGLAMKQALETVVAEINTNSTSFSLASVATLQTLAGNTVIVPRFNPQQSASMWPGHLYRFNLYSEFNNTCNSTANGTGAGDLDCDGQCVSAFLIDSTGAFISEDTTGVFRQNDPPNLPTCTQAPLCVARNLPCAVTGTALAVPWWDAASALDPTTTPPESQIWKTRTVYTILDSNGDGQINQSDNLFQLTTATAASLLPYLAITGAYNYNNPNPTSACASIASSMVAAGAPGWAAAVTNDATGTVCAQAVVRYVLGADLFNEGANPNFPPDANNMDAALDRPTILGDIFHSSPVEVEPPYPATGFLCPSGLVNQCIPALWSTPTPMDTSVSGNSYQDYVNAAPYTYRQKIVLVGANDGLLHAFNGGTWLAGQDDPTLLPGIKTSLPPYNGYYERGNLSGGAYEVWAFLPPALLSKIPLLLEGQHNFFVDGTPMVRDVWVDGTTNGLAGASPPDDIKQAQEFHTVALVQLRRGGASVFALDITNATKPGTPPTFLWMYPQPNDVRTMEFGETYDDYLPRPPPIGPVRIRADSNGGLPLAGTQTWANALGGPTPYHERWVAFIAGGFDPNYQRGRGVYMVDIWTGNTYWEYSAYPASNGWAGALTNPEFSMNYPVGSTVGMFPWGQSVVRAATETNQFFFDSATFGDAGGQIWMLRFSEPAQLSSSGLATNWFGGRMFQMRGSTQAAADCSLCGGQPIFYMTSNLALPGTAYLRVFAGTGDRFNLLDINGGTCSPTNLHACAMRGCNIAFPTTDPTLASYSPLNNPNGSFSYALGWFQTGGSNAEKGCNDFYQSTSYTAPPLPSVATGVSGCQSLTGADVQISNCPSPAVANGPNSTQKLVSGICSTTACATYLDTLGAPLFLSNATNAPQVGNWFFGLNGFDSTGNRAIFSTLAGSISYDTARLWINQQGSSTTTSGNIVLMDSSLNNPNPVASTSSEGYGIFFNHNTSVTANNTNFWVNWLDERTATTTAVQGRTITWGTVQPTLGSMGSALTACYTSLCTANNNTDLTYHYNADVVTGAPTLTDPTTGLPVRSSVFGQNVPIMADQNTIFVNQSGQMIDALVSVGGNGTTSSVAASNTVQPSYSSSVLAIPESTHLCRHTANPTSATPPTQQACGQQ